MSYKLVRDNIPDIIKEEHPNCNYAKCQDNVFLTHLLNDKLEEELIEFKSAVLSLDKYVEEAADVLTVMLAMINHMHPANNISVENILSAYRDKAHKRGEFKEGYILFEEK